MSTPKRCSSSQWYIPPPCFYPIYMFWLFPQPENAETWHQTPNIGLAWNRVPLTLSSVSFSVRSVHRKGHFPGVPGSPACPGTSQSCTVKHQACPKLFQSVWSRLKQTHGVSCPSELCCVGVRLTMALGIGAVGNGGCGTRAQDHRYFPAYKHSTLPRGSLGC